MNIPLLTTVHPQPAEEPELEIKKFAELYDLHDDDGTSDVE